MIPEELMEELYTLIYHTNLDGFERIEQAIVRIGKAYADGELKLPEEVVFAHTPDKVVEYEIATFWDDLWRRMKAEGWLNSGLTTIIALRPTGTGKEEEK